MRAWPALDELINSDNLKYVLRQFVERKLPVCYPRERLLPTGMGKVVGLAGVRRSDKTFLFFDAIRRLLEVRRTRKDLYYFVNGGEVDLCDEEGTFFINSCWSLTETQTRQREAKSMALGHERWPQAQGRLLYDEYAPGSEQEISEAQPAWRFLAQLPRI